MKQIIIELLLVVVASASFLMASKAEKNALKLEEELFIIGLTAAVSDGRAVVNQVMAKHLGLSREQLVAERKETTLPYGELFAAHEFARLGNAPFKHVAQDMKEGQSLLDIGTEHEADLKKALASARKLNKAIDKELDRLAEGKKEGAEDSDTGDSYDPAVDYLSADTAAFTPEQLALASERVYMRGGSAGSNRTGATSGAGSVMGTGQHQSGRMGGGRRGGRGPGF